jgi:hypothetical protein
MAVSSELHLVPDYFNHNLLCPDLCRASLAVMLQLLLMSGTATLLLGWHVIGSEFSCVGVFLLLLPILAFIFLNMLETATMRRRAWVRMYLRSDTWLAKLLCRKTLLILWQLVKATLLAFVLLIESRNWAGWLWWVLAADVLLMYWLTARRPVFVRQIKPGFQAFVGRQWLVVVNTLALLVALSSGQLFVPHTDYALFDWQQTAVHAAAQVNLDCELISPLARAQAVQQAWMEKGVHQGLNSLDTRWGQLMGWLVFFFWSGLSLWAWSRMLMGASIQRRDIDSLVQTDHDY